MFSNVGLRWLISRIDAPTPGSAIRSRCASARTGSGSTAGPAEKLNTRCVIDVSSSLHFGGKSRTLYRDSRALTMAVSVVVILPRQSLAATVHCAEFRTAGAFLAVT